MFNSEEEKRKLSLAIVHYAYRNTVIEDYHSYGIKMDMNFYKKIYKIVHTKLANVKNFHRYVNLFDATGRKEDFENIIKLVPEEQHFKFMRYFADIMYMYKDQFGWEWEPAKLIDVNLDNKSYANFVLSGNFLESCKNGIILDDKTMCYINKDINNRIFSLLINGYFD